MKKKIIINGDFGAFKTFAGVSRYATEVILELDKIVEQNEVEIVTPVYGNIDLKLNNIKIIKVGDKPINIWKNQVLPKYVKKNDGILIDLTQAFPLGKNDVTCVHDCIPELVESAYIGKFRRYIIKPLKLYQRKRAIKKSKIIFTVSEFSKRDIKNIYHTVSEKVVVAGNAWQHMLRIDRDDAILNKYNLVSKKFYFTLGSRVPHKNMKWIIEAARQNPSDKIIISGEQSYDKNIYDEQYSENIIFTGYITDGEVKSLMSECRAFLFPSLYEGFGIPPMEALAEGTPIIISNTSCLPSIYGDSAHYINPSKYTDINLDNILQQKVGDTKKVLSQYSWEKTAGIIWNEIKKIYG